MRRMVACAGLLLVACTTPHASAPRADMTVATDFAPNHPIDAEFTCDGSNRRLHVSWSSPPAATAEIAVVMVDQDVDNGHFVHWLVYGIAPAVAGIGPEGLPAGAQTARNSFGKAEYDGPCPPHGSAHRYTIVVFALKRASGLRAGATFDQLDRVEAVLDRGQITGTYSRA